jgi:hypothetical protein
MGGWNWTPSSGEGFNRLSSGLGVAHYDPPPPEVLGTPRRVRHEP